MNQLDSVRAWLEKLCIKVPGDWIEACLEWIQEENQGRPLRMDQLNNMVYEQWLMVDLQELNTSCLPQEVATANKLYLSGNYALQINSCVDVGTPCYGQLQKERGTENANSLVSGEQPNQPAWQPKQSRMLMLKLTDGTLSVHGMEYQQIPQLKNVVPGTKVLIQGHVLCRRGVLMLKSANIQVLGGAVDSLVETNTSENVLQAAMQDNLQHANKSERSEFSGRMLAADETMLKKETFSQPQKASFVQRVKSESSDPPRPVGGRSQPVNRLSQLQHTNNIKRENTCQTSLKTERRIDSAETETTNRLQPELEEYEWCDDMIELFDDQEDFDMFPAHPATTMLQQQTENVGPSRPSQIQNTNTIKLDSFTKETQEKKDNQQDGVSSVCHGSKVIKGDSAVSSEDMLCDFDDDFDMNDLEMIEVSESSANVNPVVASTNSDKIKVEPRESVSSVLDRDLISDTCVENHLSNSNILAGVKLEHPRSSVSALAAGGKFCHYSTTSRDSSFTKLVGFEKNTRQSAMQHTTQSVLPRSRQSVDQTKPSLPKAVIRPLQQSQPKSTSTNQAQSTMERFLGCQASFTGLRPTCSTDAEFTYLSEALKQAAAGKTFLIKGYVSTLTSKLTSRCGTDWHLSCKINDGSAVAEVDLSNKVLIELIGFSASDSLVMRQRAKTDQSVKNILSEGLQQCQQRLVDLSCLMEIQFGADSARLSVQRFIPVENKHIQVLYHRIVQQMPHN